MRNFLTIIKEFVFGVQREPVEAITIGFHTVLPDDNNSLQFQQWAKQFNVSMLHDKKVVFINS